MKKTKKKPCETLLKEEKDVQELIAGLKHSDKHIRINAAHALGEIKNNLAIECLISALKSSHLGVRRKAAIGLWKITHQDFGQDVKKWQEWWKCYEGYFGRRIF